MASLTQGCAETEPPVAEAPVAIVDDPPPCELGPAMQPVTSGPDEDGPPATGPVAAQVDAGDGTPTAEQRGLTEAKHRPRYMRAAGGIGSHVVGAGTPFGF